MKKIKVISLIEVYDLNTSFEEIKKSYINLKEKTERELLDSGLKDEFELEFVVKKFEVQIKPPFRFIDFKL